MKSKNQLIADILRTRGVRGVIVDVGFAQTPNLFLEGEVHGVDLVEVPLPAGYISGRVCDLNVDPLPFSNASADAVTMGCVLAHLANPLKALAEVNRVVKDKGIVVVTSPNPNYYWETVLNIFYHFFKKRVSRAKHEEHFFEFSRYNMRTTARRTGFEVVGEIGCRFHLVKTPIKFHPLKFPGLAYEIIYILEKRREPSAYATFETKEGISNIPAKLFNTPS